MLPAATEARYHAIMHEATEVGPSAQTVSTLPPRLGVQKREGLY